jgi:deferrochelatase/peroxidase EfeB
MADLENVQAIVARSSAKKFHVVLLYKFESPRGAKRFLQEWTKGTLAGLAPEIDNRPSQHFLFTWSGVEALLENHPTLDPESERRELEPFFVDPTQAPGAAVAEQLGFLGASAPEGWWHRRFTSADIDLAIYVSLDSPEQKAERLEQLRTSAAACGLRELELPSFADRALSGFRPADGRLHFGYRDGVTSVQIDWAESRAPGAVDFRELVVGYPSEDYPTAPAKSGAWQEFARDSSFAGLAWIYQDVARFNKFLEVASPQAAPHSSYDAKEYLASKLMGRWRDGSPLAKFPSVPPPAPDFDNSFGYADDPFGSKTPLASHVRLTFSRDQRLKFADQVRFPAGPPRLVRRGFSYGPPLDGQEDDGVDRGVVGLFFFARVNEQFYTVLRWMQKTGFSDSFKSLPNGLNAQDPLLGNRNTPKANQEFCIAVEGGNLLRLQLSDFVRYKGVAVFFVPSLRALEVLCSD